MITQRAELPIVAFSVRVYQALLIAYPTKFQQEYGSHMMQAFRDCCLRTIRQSGTNGMVRLWAITLFDLIQSVVSEHSRKEIEMKKEMKPEDIRMAGRALISGGIALALIIVGGTLGASGWYLVTTILTFICLPLLVVGTLGLRNRFGDKAGSFGKNMLLIGAILGPTTSVIGFVLQNVSELWTLIFIGPIILFVCLVVFGLIGLYKKPLPRWNILPIIAGLWYPTKFVAIMITGFTTGNWPTDASSLTIADAILGILQVASLVALGYVLKSDVPEAKAVAA